MERINVPIADAIKAFDEFISQENNHRILFSGAFGSGKTYFLNEYFEQKKDKYEVFYVSPVNYCISRNEDITRLLQYDLLVEIVSKNLLPDTEEKYAQWETVNHFVYFNLFHIVKDVVAHCGTIGKKVSDVCDTVSKWYKEYNKFSEKVNRQQSDELVGIVKELSEELLFDQYSELIGSIITNIDEERKPILIIDDLDRIDPEHIFRLLNVFSAQLSNCFATNSLGINDEHNNKYGFDKVIFVCDIDNIRSIFHAKYGQNTDFSGYIDKFYSTQPYLWDNKQELINVVYQYVNSVRSELPKDGQRRLLSELMRILVNQNAINLRKFVEKEGAQWEWPYRKASVSFSNLCIYTVEIVDFVLFIFGTKEDAIDNLRKHSEKISVKTRFDDYGIVNFLLPLLDENYNKYTTAQNINKENDHRYDNKTFDMRVEYKIVNTNNRNNNYPQISKITSLSKNEEMGTVPFLQLLSIAVEKYSNEYVKTVDISLY